MDAGDPPMDFPEEFSEFSSFLSNDNDTAFDIGKVLDVLNKDNDSDVDFVGINSGINSNPCSKNFSFSAGLAFPADLDLGLAPEPAAGYAIGGAGNTFEFVTQGLLLTAVSVFGLAGNIISIIVLSRPPMKGSFSTLLIGKEAPSEGRLLPLTEGTSTRPGAVYSV